MIISQYFIWFIVFSFIGWIYECTYCTFRTHHWQNRGFLYGPICPIYGTGAATAVFVFNNIQFTETGSTPVWEVFLICMIGSAIIEYATSYVLEKLFHAIWWDYSKVPFNLHGRICLPASLGFGVAGVLIVRYIIPLTASMSGFLPPLAKEALALGFMAVFAGDFVLTVSGLTELVNKIEIIEQELNERMETAYQIVEDKRQLFEDTKQLVEERVQEYEQNAAERIREYAGQLNISQKHALRSMKRFKSEDTAGIAEKVKDSLRNLAIRTDKRKK